MKAEKKVIKKIKGNSFKNEKIERVSTGIANLDSLIEGGFKKNSTNLVVGETGSGKTIFGVQFLIEGIKKGEKCIFITFEESKNEFYSNMAKFGFNLKNLEQEGKFFFLEYTPEKVKTMLEEGGGIIETLVLTKNIKRVVIDSMTSFGLLFENDLEKRRSLLALFSMLKKWDCTTILAYEKDVSGNDKVAPNILEFESDSIVLLHFPRNEKERERYLEILKMRGTRHSSQIHKFSIEKNGIVLEKNPVGKKLKLD